MTPEPAATSTLPSSSSIADCACRGWLLLWGLVLVTLSGGVRVGIGVILGAGVPGVTTGVVPGSSVLRLHATITAVANTAPRMTIAFGDHFLSIILFSCVGWMFGLKFA